MFYGPQKPKIIALFEKFVSSLSVSDLENNETILSSFARVKNKLRNNDSLKRIFLLTLFFSLALDSYNFFYGI